MGWIRKREEDPADKWLRENDPYYTGKGKAKNVKYPYLTPDQEVRRSRKEIPLSSLGDVDMDFLRLSHDQ